jgi:hypothetical protein
VNWLTNKPSNQWQGFYSKAKVARSSKPGNSKFKEINRLYQINSLKHLALFVTILLMLTLVLPSTSLFAQSDSQFFPETNKSVNGKFLEYWRANGGLPVFGYPITEATSELDPETGQVFLTQWFERNRFELHPENKGTKYEVLLGLVGKDLRREALGVDYTFLPTTPKDGDNNRFFNETGHNLSQEFLNYWQSKGGLERFGFPLSEARNEVDSETGKVFLTQWFERARFEWHPENKGTEAEVLLGLLGKQLKTAPPRAQFKWEMLSDDPLDALALDNQDNLWVAMDRVPPHAIGDFITKIVKFDNQGHQLFEFRPTPVQIRGIRVVIRAMTFDKEGNLYLAKSSFADTNYAIQVEKFDAQGHSLLTFGSKGTKPGQFPSDITGLAVDQAGYIYVSTGNPYPSGLSGKGGILNKYNQNGDFIGQVGSVGKGAGQFLEPSYLALDPQSNLLVVDNARGDVQKLDSSGNFVGLVGSSCLFNTAGNSATIRHLAINQQGRVYLSYTNQDFDDYSLCIQRLSPDNKSEVVFTNSGLAMGQIHKPASIAVDNQDNLFAFNIIGQAAITHLDKFHFS